MNEGTAIEAEDSTVPMVKFPCNESILDCLTSSPATPPTNLHLGSYLDPNPDLHFQVVNGWLLAEGSYNHCLTQEKFSSHGTRIDVEWIDKVLTVACCPGTRCDWKHYEDHDALHGQTAEFFNSNFRVRDKIFNSELHYDTDFDLGYDGTTRQKVRVVVDEGQLIWYYNDKERGRGTTAGAKIEDGFHFGIFTHYGEIFVPAAIYSITVSVEKIHRER